MLLINLALPPVMLILVFLWLYATLDLDSIARSVIIIPVGLMASFTTYCIFDSDELVPEQLEKY